MQSNKSKVAVLIIDPQNDFCEDRPDQGGTGSLYVPGALADMLRGARFIQKNREFIKQIFVSLDTHSRMQIFHPSWWKDNSGKEEKKIEPFTPITLKDVSSGTYRPVIEKEWTYEYLKKLEEQGEITHMVWPEHCILGTWGHQIQEDIRLAIEWWQEDYGSAVNCEYIRKGINPFTEFYGIFQPQVAAERVEKSMNSLGNETLDFNERLVADLINGYDKIYAFGEAKSHCFGMSIKQLCSRNIGRLLLKKMTILEDCMSDIPGFEDFMGPVFKEAVEEHGMTIAKSNEVDVLADLKK